MALNAEWQPDGHRATITDDVDDLWVTLELVNDWYPPGEREPIDAWVVEWLDRSGEEPRMVADRLDEPADPAIGAERMSELSELAATAARGLPPEEPDGFGHAETGLVEGTEIHTRIELISHAIQSASGRLNEAARVTEPWGKHWVLISLTETLSWVRALDYAMSRVWVKLEPDVRAEMTRRIDEALERPGWDAKFRAWAKATREETGYSDWTLGLVARSTAVSREELRGLRWLAGKMLHFGPLPAVELRHWRPGEQPRWKWRPAAEIFPGGRGERGNHDRQAYDKYLAGRDVIGTFNLFNQLLETEFLAFEITGRQERQQPR